MPNFGHQDVVTMFPCPFLATTRGGMSGFFPIQLETRETEKFGNPLFWKRRKFTFSVTQNRDRLAISDPASKHGKRRSRKIP